MARIRRPKKIDGSEYTFGGSASAASTSASEFVKIAWGSLDQSNAAFNRFLKNGDTLEVTVDEGTASVPREEYIYFDNAFENSTGTVTLEYLNGATAMPAGMTFTANTDSVDADTGWGRISGTPTVVGQNSFKIKIDYPQGRDDEQAEITYKLTVFPVGFTPVWGSTSLPSRIVIGAGLQVLANGPTTGYAGASYSLSNVSGFPRGFSPSIDPDTGFVLMNSVPDAPIASSVHAFTVTADLGQYGTASQDFTGSIEYGLTYGGQYFGPANLRKELIDTGHDYRTSFNISDRDGSGWFNYGYRSGALYKYYDPAGNDYEENTPYVTQNGYGNHWENRDQAFHYTNVSSDVDVALGRGYLISEGRTDRKMNSSSNHSMIEIVWRAPIGATSFSAVCVGAGAPGTYTWSSMGGGGGGLAWLNAITCEPGEEFDIGIGLGRYAVSANSTYCGGSSYIRRRSNGEFLIIGQAGGRGHPADFDVFADSTVTQPNGDLIWTAQSNNTDQRNGGGFAYNNAYGAGGGGKGGNATSRSGAGAGGYRGDGGVNAANGTGGGGAGGTYYSSTYGGSAGGGVGLDGQGWNGAIADSIPRTNVDAGSGLGGTNGSYTTNTQGRGPYRYGGGGGSGGARGIFGENAQQSTPEHGSGIREIGGGHHGGGGGGSGSNASYGGGSSGPGGVRIIWGAGADGSDREFPYTYTTEDPDMKYNGEKN